MVFKIGTTTVIDENNFPAGKVSQNVTVFTSSGTFAVPAGVTAIHAYIFGGGGGGSAGTAVNGGYGGFMFKRDIAVTPSTNISITVGAGGTASNTTNGNAGTASSFVVGSTTYVANGGNAGAGATDGAGSNGDINTNTSQFNTNRLLLDKFPQSLNLLLLSEHINMFLNDRTVTRPVGLGNSAAWSGFNSSYLPGARGSGESLSTNNDSSGGEGGAVILTY